MSGGRAAITSRNNRSTASRSVAVSRREMRMKIASDILQNAQFGDGLRERSASRVVAALNGARPALAPQISINPRENGKQTASKRRMSSSPSVAT